MKILITGGAGFIGSHITDRLLARSDQILVIDNYTTGRLSNLDKNDNLTIVEGNIRDEPLVEGIFDKFQPEVIVHAVASYKNPDDWIADIKTNVMGTANIVRSSKRFNVRRLIYFQTALCYGIKPLEQPITLSHPLQPANSSYAISKTAGEQYIALSGIDFISFRLANIYGPRNLTGPLATFYYRLTNSKRCFVIDTRRDGVYVQDLVDVVIKAIDGMGNRGYYHISSGRDYAIKEMFDATVKALEIELSEPVEIRPRGEDDAYTIFLDSSKTNKDFSWEAKTPLKGWVRHAVEWYKAHGVEQTYTHLKGAEKE